MFKRRLYYHTKISNISDTRLLFNMTKHTMTNTYEQNQTFLEILEDIQERVVGFKTDVSIPFDNQSMNEILLERKFCIFGNLSHEEVFEVGGHACVSLVGLFKQIYAHQIPIGFTEQIDVDGDNRNRSNTNGSQAMKALLQYMKGA